MNNLAPKQKMKEKTQATGEGPGRDRQDDGALSFVPWRLTEHIWLLLETLCLLVDLVRAQAYFQDVGSFIQWRARFLASTFSVALGPSHPSPSLGTVSQNLSPGNVFAFVPVFQKLFFWGKG